MVFSSTIFLLIFLPVFLIVYHLVGRQWKNYIILIFSIFFYSWGAPQFVFILLTSTIIDFFIVKKIDASKVGSKKQMFLAFSLIMNLGLLAYFKYANFFIDNVNIVLQSIGIEAISWVKVVLPIGISFYTFQTLTYSIDVYRGVHKPLKKLSNYLLYIMSFPQMIAGPIVRFNHIADQIVERKETIDDKLLGFYRFIIGLAKKVLIANVMAEQAEIVFALPMNELTTSAAWIGILAYTFQIYFDFSGYSDMAIGLGKMMGFQFPENFNSPYISRSISEFWRRWHMTLGGFMRDYLYIPLGGSRVNSKYRLYFNLSIVFILSGLWHGAAWNFIIWGAFHGLFLVLDRLFLIRLMNYIGQLPSIMITFFITMIGWVIFRIESVDGIIGFLNKMFRFESFVLPVITVQFWYVLIVAVLFSFITIFSFGKKMEFFVFVQKSYSMSTNVMMTLGSIILLALSIGSITASGFNPFIYFRF